MPQTQRIAWVTKLACAAVTLLLPAHTFGAGAVREWNANNGTWNQSAPAFPSPWLGGQKPEPGDDVILQDFVAGPGVPPDPDTRSTYDMTLTLRTLTVDIDGGEYGLLQQGRLVVDNLEIIGEKAAGAHSTSGLSTTIYNHRLDVGFGAPGSFNLWGDFDAAGNKAELRAPHVRLGVGAGTSVWGEFFQRDSKVTITTLDVGIGAIPVNPVTPPQDTVYTVQNGVCEYYGQTIRLGQGRPGNFVQNAGKVDLTTLGAPGVLDIGISHSGYNFNPESRYSMNGGTFKAGAIRAGYSDVGYFDQSGGTVEVKDLYLSFTNAVPDAGTAVSARSPVP